MTTYLDRLGAELGRAAERLAADDLPRRSPVPVVAAALLAAAAVVLVLLLAGGRAQEREVRPATAPSGYALPGPPPELAALPLGVADAGDANAAMVAGQLRSAGWRTSQPRHGLRTSLHVANLALVYGTATRAQARLAARTLGVERVQAAPGALRARRLTLVVGPHPQFAGAVAAFRARFAVLGADGTGTADTPRGPVRLSVTGAWLCVFEGGGGGCGPFDAAVRGDSVITKESEDGHIRSLVGAVPDGPRTVTLAGKRIRVHDSVWVHGPTRARHAVIDGLGRVDF